uniref:hypothetical protein n=1 Tax=Stenotrophomonas maltophilia TaxID=40324 RepID=UPI0019549DDD
ASYLCFGPIVAIHYTGYLKALGVFYILVPILTASVAIIWKKRAVIFSILAISVAWGTYHNWQARILPGQSNDDITH